MARSPKPPAPSIAGMAAGPAPSHVRLSVDVFIHDDGSITCRSESRVNRPKELFRHYANAVREIVYEIDEIVYEIEKRPRR